MAIKKKDIRKFISSFKKEKHLVIFINGGLGVGKTTFATQLLKAICKELKIELNINMINFNMKEFLRCRKKVKFLGCYSGVLIDKKKLNKHICILETRGLEEMKIESYNYMELTVLSRGNYLLNDEHNKFSKRPAFKKELIEKKRDQHIKKIMNEVLSYAPVKKDKKLNDLEYLHKHSIEEQLIMEETKAKAKYGDKDHPNHRWFIILSEEFGEVARNINIQQNRGHCSREAQENLEYELLQVMATCKMWLDKLREKGVSI